MLSRARCDTCVPVAVWAGSELWFNMVTEEGRHGDLLNPVLV